MIVATTQFSLKGLKKEYEFWKRVRKLCEAAKSKKADAILFPEYFSLSLVLIGENGSMGFRQRLLASPAIESAFIHEFRSISDQLDLLIVAGTIPHVEGPSILNRSWIFVPGEAPLFQDKVNMTRFESEEWKIGPGKPSLQLFRHAGALCAVATCYDVEFPHYCAAAAQSRVDVLFVPSCTDDVHGYWRVRHCAQARAVENQCFVVMSSVVDGNPEYPEIAEHYGQGGIYSPCDTGFPEQGILKTGSKNREGLTIAKLDLAAIQRIRKNGTVLNLRDSSKFEQIMPIH